ncbi:MAG: bis(5'-nucleosyl)-tetraphosphatase (symmetrical) YqeK [Lachnospiraceae bacterium]|nr:bis(5'-nucleosyl)-tetraphosphatase (symmetrical) YqeK [Lachnospiraceae bacterium]
MSIDFETIRKKLRKALDAHRYEHTLGVAYTAAMMAEIFGEDSEKAKLAGFLHDCAKCIPDNKKISLCKKAGFLISETELQNPSLLHGKAGSILAKDKYGIDDPDILNAIIYHTTGRPGMSLLEKIIFVADYVEPGRKDHPGMHLDEVRTLAMTDLDQAVIRILGDTLRYLEGSSKPIDETTQKTYDHYIQTIKGQAKASDQIESKKKEI